MGRWFQVMVRLSRLWPPHKHLISISALHATHACSSKHWRWLGTRSNGDGLSYYENHVEIFQLAAGKLNFCLRKKQGKNSPNWLDRRTLVVDLESSGLILGTVVV